MFYAPYHAQQILKPYPELSDDSSLLSRSFSLVDNNESDEAWILWINEEFSDRINSRTGSADLYDDTNHLVTINRRVKFGNTTIIQCQNNAHLFLEKCVCEWPGGCRSIAPVCGELDSEGE